MKRTNRLFTALILVASEIVCAASLAARTQQSPEPGQDQLAAIRSAKTVRIVVRLNPLRLAPNLPFSGVVARLVGHAGLKVVDSGADLTLNVEANVQSTYHFKYTQPEKGKPTKEVTPTGTTMRGVLRFDGANGVSLFSRPFEAFANDESPSSLYQAMNSFSLTTLESLAKVYGPRTLISALKDDELRWQASSLLKRMGAVDALIAALKDDDARTRVDAATVFMDLQDPRAVEPLIAALKDVNADVRAAVVAALSYLKDPRVIESLIPVLKDESKKVRLYVASAFERAKDPRVFEPLLAALKDPSLEVRGRVAMALASQKDPRALGALLQALRELKSNESGSPAGNQEALVVRGEVRRAINQMVEGSKDPVVVEQLAVALKDPDIDVRLAAFSALAKLEAIDHLINTSKDEDKSVRTAAVQFFGQTKDPRAVGPLITAAQDSDKEIRRIAVLGLQKFKDARSVEPLINLLKEEDPNTSAQAAYALGEIRDARAVEPLLAAMGSPNERLRSSAAEALGKVKDPRAVDQLIAALKDQSSSVRLRAAGALGEIKDQRAIEPLIPMLKDQFSRWDAAEALKKITGQDFGTDHGKWNDWWQKSKGK